MLERPLKILQVTNMYPAPERPAYGIFVKEQIDALRDLGVEERVLFIEGFRGKGRYLRGVGEVRRAVRSFRPDLVHAHFGFTAVVAILACIGLGVPVVASFAGDDLLGRARWDGSKTPLSLVLAWLVRQGARFLAASIVKSRASLERLPPSARSRAHVIPNGVDLDRFRPAGRREALHRLGFSPRDRLVLFGGGRSVPVKNFPLAEAAFDRLRPSIPDLHLEALEGVDRKEVPVWVNAASVLLLPSHSEGSPNVVKEAMACGTPVVATDVGDVAHLLEGVEGCSVVAPNAESVAEGIREALLHRGRTKGRERLRRLGLGGRETALRIVDLYRSVSGKR